MRIARPLCLLLIPLVLGCVRRTLTVNSDPPGALVYLNDHEVGRTPLTRDFLWYGNYDVALRMDGYETLKTHAKITAPWWQWPPIDLLAEMFPLRDQRILNYTLTPAEGVANAQELMKEAVELRGQLGVSATRPSTRPGNPISRTDESAPDSARAARATRPSPPPEHP